MLALSFAARRLGAGLATVLLALCAASAARAGDAVPTPEAVLGFVPGQARRLAGWDDVSAYLAALDAASPRVRVVEIGRSTHDRPLLMAIVTSEANQARLESIRAANARLADPRGLEEAEAERLVASGRAIVAMAFSIHSTEVGGTLTALRLLHRLASLDDEPTQLILENAVLLAVPSANPDGTDLVADWYRRQLGTPYEGTAPPVLYHPYAGHDNNRDWYAFTQAETRAVVERLHNAWHPQIVHDVHQMGPDGARLFVPPYVDPWEPNVDPALVAAANALGAHVASVLTTAGRSGVVTGALFDAWAPSRAYPHSHGAVRLLSETASARLASPYEVKSPHSDALDVSTPSARLPLPWPGGRWELADVVGYQLDACLAVLAHAAREREFWLRTTLAANRRACARREPAAFVIPRAQADPPALARLLDVLRLGAVEVEEAAAPFEAEGRTYEAGSHVVRLQQPASGFAKMLLERQRYPDLRDCPSCPPRRPYDVAAHTLSLLLGVEVSAVREPLAAPLQPAAPVAVAPGTVDGDGPSFAIAHGPAELTALCALLASGVRARWTLKPFEEAGRVYPPGTLLVPAAARARLAGQVRETGISARGVRARPNALRLSLPRVGVYRSWVPALDEGWTRFVLEREVHLPYQSLHDRELRKGGLRARFDAIVLPGQPPRLLRDGHPAGTMPAEYTGGLGEEGGSALRRFVEQGGTLVALDRASDYAIETLELPVRDVLHDVAPGEFSCPGSILGVRPDPSLPLAHGLPDPLPVWFDGSPAFEAARGMVAATYAVDPPLLSGFLQGAERLRGRAALVEVPLGKGRVVLVGFRAQYRGQSRVSYPVLLNALFLSAAER